MSTFKDLIYAGTNLRNFGVVCTGVNLYNSAKRDYTAVSIPGRNGDLLMHGTRLENIEVSYDCSIVPYYPDADFETQVMNLRELLYTNIGYQKLADGFHPDEYRMAYYEGPFEAEVGQLRKWGSFTLTFNCQPQRWLVSGDTGETIPAESITSIEMPAGCGAAYPEIEIAVSGSASASDDTKTYTDTSEASSTQDTGNASVSKEYFVGIGDYKIYIDFTNASGTMVISSSVRNAYEKTTNTDLSDCIACNAWPVIGRGTTTINNNTPYEITLRPGWWRV